MNRLSVVIITFNEASNIGRCIDSVKTVADEIIVLDSFSTDDTVNIASQKGALVYQQKFTGYIQQKNNAIQLSSYNLVLSLDADEALSEELAASIAIAKADDKTAAYSMNRCNIYCGHPIRHGLWYPDRKLRLFDKRYGYCGGLNPHDKIILSQPVPNVQLKGDLLHYTYKNYKEYQERNEEVSTVAATSLFNSRSKVHWSKIYLSPVWAFLNGYFLRLGFLDGWHGLVIACQTTSQSFKKYYKLRQLQKQSFQKLNLQNIEFKTTA
jgi:glycosyltransferase involved in cell wall biosynthesis